MIPQLQARMQVPNVSCQEIDWEGKFAPNNHKAAEDVCAQNRAQIPSVEEKE
jgi:hypothetical protein